MIKIRPENRAAAMKLALIFFQCPKVIDCFFQKLPTHTEGCKVQIISSHNIKENQKIEECSVFQLSQNLRNVSELFFNLFRELFEKIAGTNHSEGLNFLRLSLHWIGPLGPRETLLLNKKLISKLREEQIESPAAFLEKITQQLKVIDSDWLDDFCGRIQNFLVTDLVKSQVYFLLRVFIEGIQKGDEPLESIETDKDRKELERAIKNFLSG